MRFPKPVSCRLGLIGMLLLAGGPGCTAGPEPTSTSTSTSTAPAPGAAMPSAGALDCPQTRQAEQAPDSYLALTNPLPPSEQYIAYGRALYEAQRAPASCAACHGADGRGGPAGMALVPPPRNFACAETMKSLPDGQLYWVIARGSGEFHDPARQGAQQVGRPGRRAAPSMQPYSDQLSETQIWELVTFIRTLTEPSNEQ